MTKTTTTIPEISSEPESLFKKLLDIALTQHSLCTSAEFPESGLEEFTRLLSERRRILTCLEETRAVPGSNPAITDLISQIIHTDRLNQKVIKEKMGQAKQSLHTLHQGRHLRKAYSPGTPQREGIFLDQKNP